MPVDDPREIVDRLEGSILLLCARPSLDHKSKAALRKLLEEELDWNCVCNLAIRHGITGLVYKNLNHSSAANVPRWAMDRLRMSSQALLGRSRLMAGELVRILGLMEREAILAIPFKGPVLAHTLYGDLCAREFSDLDIVVRPRDLSAAASLILREGYRINGPSEMEVQEVLQRHDNEVGFVRDELGVVLDLHRSFSESRFKFKFEIEGVFERCRTQTFGDKDILTFSPEDMVLLLSNHGSLHAWASLKWLCDLSHFMCIHDKLDWVRILMRAQELGMRRRLLLGLFLAQDLLGTVLPESAAAAIQADSKIEPLATAIKAGLFQDPWQEWSPLDKRRFQGQLVQGLGAKVRYFLVLAFRTNMADWQSLNLPPYLGFLHYIVRPIRLLVRYGTRLIHKAVFLKRNALN
jgi:hypothetical protein